MTKTLVVGYTPRKGSYTKVLLDESMQLIKGKTELIYLDLAETPPDLLLIEQLHLIMEWNNGKRDFSETEQAILANHHQLIEQVLQADHIILAFPIYNFTMPATVKAWIDAIVVSGKTFSFSPEQGFQGLCTNKKALVILVAGFNYEAAANVKEYASSTIKQNLDFMGMSSELVTAFGVDQNRDNLESILDIAKLDIKDVVNRWFPVVK